jgi:membrane protein implicated in regulation of membrane protease activity
MRNRTVGRLARRGANRLRCLGPAVRVKEHRVSLAFWAWITVAVVCVLGECVTGGLLTLPWAVGAFVAALLEAAQVSSGWQWIAFVTVSSVLLVLGQRLIIKR